MPPSPEFASRELLILKLMHLYCYLPPTGEGGEGKCCLEGVLSLPDLNVQLSCLGGTLLAEPLTTTPTTEMPTTIVHSKSMHALGVLGLLKL